MFIVYGIYDDAIPYGYFDTIYGDIVGHMINTDVSEWMVPGTLEN